MGLVRRIVEMLLQAGISSRVGRNDGGAEHAPEARNDKGAWNDGGNTDKKGMGAAGRSFQNLPKSKNFSQNARKID